MKIARMTTQTTVTTTPPLLDRIEALHAELNTLIEEWIDEHMVPGVPRSAIVNELWGQVGKQIPGRCPCRAARYIAANETK